MSALVIIITKDSENIPWKFAEDFNLSEAETSKYVTAYIEYKKTLDSASSLSDGKSLAGDDTKVSNVKPKY